MSISEELGNAIQYYCDNHERMGDAWLVCKLNDIVYDCKEAEGRIKELEEALMDVIDGYPAYDLVNITGLSLERCQEIWRIAKGEE